MKIERPNVISLALYRLWRQKRLLIIVPAMVVLAALFAGWAGELQSYYYAGDNIAFAAAIAFGCTVVAAILFPGSPMETFLGGITAAFLIATEPWQSVLFAPEFKGGAFTPVWIQAIAIGGAALVIWCFLLIAAVKLSAALPDRRSNLRYRTFIPNSDPEVLRAAFSLREKAASGPVSFGEKQWDGYVPARISVRGHVPEDLSIGDVTIEYETAYCGREGEAEVHNVRIDGALREVRQTFRAARGGTWIETEERPGPPHRLTALAVQLNEAGADLTRARADHALGRKSPAIILGPQYALNCLIARMMRMPKPKEPATPAE